jgi:hypothetical protein
VTPVPLGEQGQRRCHAYAFHALHAEHPVLFHLPFQEFQILFARDELLSNTRFRLATIEHIHYLGFIIHFYGVIIWFLIQFQRIIIQQEITDTRRRDSILIALNSHQSLLLRAKVKRFKLNIQG